MGTIEDLWQEAYIETQNDLETGRWERIGMSLEIQYALNTLSEREDRILTQRYGLDGQGARTLQQVADSEHVTKERIRQIEAKAVRKLRHPSRSRRLSELVQSWYVYEDSRWYPCAYCKGRGWYWQESWTTRLAVDKKGFIRLLLPAKVTCQLCNGEGGEELSGGYMSMTKPINKEDR